MYFDTSVPLNKGSNKILFSNHFERRPEEILKLDGKVSISQALTALLSASCISWLKEKKKNLSQSFLHIRRQARLLGQIFM